VSTAILLEWMQNRPARPWDADGPFTARTLARLLAAFEIHPRVQRNGKDNPARGYQLQDFAEPWQAHLGFKIPVTDHDPAEIVNKDAVCNAITDSAAVSADDLLREDKTHVTDQDQSEIPNKDAGCNTATDIAVVSRKENATISMFQLEASS
jgi:hypothetical protein